MIILYFHEALSDDCLPKGKKGRLLIGSDGTTVITQFV